ncbi:MAG: VTT domain-containing protein [Anaerolineae bacterium]|nr:VTT domain-containing protein [Anaerolineae bacterium]
MIETESTKISLRAVIFGVAAFTLVSLGMIAFLEWIGVERLHDVIQAAGPLAPLAYILLKILTNVIAPLSSGPIQLSSGVLFGLWPGVFYSLIGEVVGGTINFWLARRFGRPVVRRFVGQGGLQRVDEFTAQLGGWRALLYGRLFLFSFYDFISYAAGFTQTITLHQYLLVSVLAGFIPSFLNVAVGVTLIENRDAVFAIYAGIALLSVLPLLIRHLIKRRQSSPLV